MGSPSLGLEHSQSVYDAPGTYNLDSNNCVNGVINTGDSMGLELPKGEEGWGLGRGSTPRKFGEELKQQYPNWEKEEIEP
jgi:hypothetical protein